MQEVIFFLGNMGDLCWAELQAVLGSAVNLQRLDQRLASAKLQPDFDIKSLQKKLGGTIKIGKLIKKLPQETEASTINYQLIEYLVSLGQAKVYFALGELGRDHLEPLDSRWLKARLEENGLKVRFAATSRRGAGAALLLHQAKWVELLVTNTPDRILITHTLSVQDIDDWSYRDRAKPYSDHKKGMLPPKLARMMINLAGPSKQPRRLYDPFCGSGTLLLEAAVMGNYELCGSDLDVKAVIGTGENLDWLRQAYHLEAPARLFTRDVTAVRVPDLGGQKVDLIVSEPFLGRQTPRDEQLPGVFRGLQKLYWGAFRTWTQLLVPGARLVIVFPRVTARDGSVYTLDHLLDKLMSLGYNKKSQDLIYARDQATVQREICVFEWQKN
ncbi:hypothetical protein IJJ08_01345 [bacterium]|nr:hypothetical protein [bacterium]